MNIFIMVKIVYMTTLYNVQILKLSFLLTVEGVKYCPKIRHLHAQLYLG